MLAACQIPLLSFFFQAEDGIRDWSVTGVQTCALPICECRVLAAGDPLPALPPRPWLPGRGSRHRRPLGGAVPAACRRAARGSEERRVGKEWRSWWSADDQHRRQVTDGYGIGASGTRAR